MSADSLQPVRKREMKKQEKNAQAQHPCKKVSVFQIPKQVNRSSEQDNSSEREEVIFFEMHSIPGCAI